MKFYKASKCDYTGNDKYGCAASRIFRSKSEALEWGKGWQSENVEDIKSGKKLSLYPHLSGGEINRRVDIEEIDIPNRLLMQRK